MFELMEMTRHMNTWLGLSSATPCDGLPLVDDEEPLQETSGIVTILVIYLGMAGLLAVLNFCTTNNSTGDDMARARAKRELVAMERYQLQRLERQGRFIGSSLAPSRMINLPLLNSEVTTPRGPTTNFQHESEFLEQQTKEPETELQQPTAWQDPIDEEEEEDQDKTVAPSCSVPHCKNSTFFDIPLES
ncbi:uncharacterized protein LOC108109980 [Drosophila eugracilis]|uniref:uncharacterized protein LOC108109980 n=1 Tax=Drosophila eugracilis TaxID=29029 RepID=UPI0007E7B991|nr:uncharacterized protein LOC108109980 [Drosophila eugracilis]